MPNAAPLDNPQFCIRFATPADRDAILEFIATHWSSTHAFVQYPQLFDYEHLVEDQLRFVVAYDKQEDRIVGIQGYIHSNASATPDVWGAIWKVADTRIPAVGYRIHQYLKDAFAPGAYIGVGVNANTFGLHRKMGHDIDELDHYYRLGAGDSYRIALVTDDTREPVIAGDAQLHELADWPACEHSFDPARFRDQSPYKDAWYIRRRYFDHPVYTYRVFGIRRAGGSCEALLVTREVRQNGTKALRIVDLIGDASPLAGTAADIQALLDRHDYEYVDFYCHGIDHEILRRAGFRRKDPQDPNIIPNYFEPFVQKNVPIAYVTDTPGVRICKADADQDRPNSFPGTSD